MLKLNQVVLAGLLVILTIAFTACNKQEGTTGQLRIKMTDAPIDYDSVNVEILDVEVQVSNGPNGSGWTNLNTNAGIYNLLELQNDITTVLVDTNVLPVGKINQMRLILGNNNNVVVDSVSYPLELSSQANTGLKFNVNADILPNDLVEILIDFDAAESIVFTGNEKYKLKPVIRVEDVTYF